MSNSKSRIVKWNLKSSTGQTLITLLFFMIIAITMLTGTLIVIFNVTTGQTKIQQSRSAYYIAESGMENALIRLLRDPAYNGETLTIGEGTAVVNITNNGSIYIATSSATVGNFVQKIQVVASYTNNILSIQTWKELF